MIAEPVHNTMEIRDKLCQVNFEKFHVPAMFLCKDAVLAAFSHGKYTALVVDSGAGKTTTVPVHDGYVLHRGVQKSKMAGDILDEIFEHMLFTEKKIDPLLSYQLKKTLRDDGQIVVQREDLPLTTQSYHRFMLLELVQDIKQTVCRVSDKKFDPTANASIPSVQYEMPDGTMLNVGVERFMVGERLLVPDPSSEIKDDFGSTPFPGLPKMLQQSVEICDADIRKELYQSIIITGGNTLYAGFPNRLKKELEKAIPPAFKVRTLQPATKAERKFGVWIGASILGSLGSFHQMWFSRSEYEEHGASALARKCP